MSFNGNTNKIFKGVIIILTMLLTFSLTACDFRSLIEQTEGIKRVPLEQSRDSFEEYKNQILDLLTDYETTVDIDDPEYYEFEIGPTRSNYSITIIADLNVNTKLNVALINRDGDWISYYVRITNILYSPSEIKHDFNLDLMIKISEIISEKDCYKEDFIQRFLSDTSGRYDISKSDDEYIYKYFNYDFFEHWVLDYKASKIPADPTQIAESITISGIPKIGQK